MATGDISSVTINADGWTANIKVLGFTTGETFSFGDVVAGTVKGVLTVTATGYDGSKNVTAPTRTLYLDHVVRKAYPSDASNDETVSGSDIIVRVALNSRIRSTDTVTISIAAGCFINTGGSAQTSNAVSGLSCTNSSGLSYPKCITQWAQRPFDRWQSNPTLAVSARHMYGVAAVDIILTDAHSHTVTTAATIQSRLRSATGYYVEEWAATCNLSTLTQGDAITARYVVYPKVGDSGAVFDSNTPSVTDNNILTGQCNYTYYNDKSASMNVYAVVNFSTGSDGSGVSSSNLVTANASPYLTIAGAITAASANIIYVRAGTGNVLGASVTTPPSKGYFRQVQVYPGDGTVTLQLTGTAAYSTPHLSYEGIKYQLAAGANWFDGSSGTNYLSFLNCTMDSNGQADNTTVSGFGYRSAAVFFSGCTFNDASKFGFGDSFGARICHWFDGCSLPCSAAVTHFFGCYRYVGCYVQNAGIGSTDFQGESTTGPLSDPFFCEYNKVMGLALTSAGVGLNAGQNSTAFAVGIACVGNIVEVKSGTSIALAIHNDSMTATMPHTVVWHNTVAGERANMCYNSKGTVSYLLSDVSVIGNAFGSTSTSADSYNIKTDTFTADGGASGNRVGNWPELYGVDYVSNAGAVARGAFENEFSGIGSFSLLQNQAGTGGSATMNFTSDKSVSGTGAGNGDYTPAAGSSLLKALASGYAPIKYDINGNPVLNNGNGSIGAIQPPAASAVIRRAFSNRTGSRSSV